MRRGLAIATARTRRVRVTVTVVVTALDPVAVTGAAAVIGAAAPTPPALPPRGPSKVFAVLPVVATRVTVVRLTGVGNIPRPTVRLRTHVNSRLVGGR